MKNLFNNMYFISKYSNEYNDLIKSGDLKEIRYVNLMCEYEQYDSMIIFNYKGRFFLFTELRNKGCLVGFPLHCEVYSLGYLHTNKELKLIENVDKDKFVSVFRKLLEDNFKWQAYGLLTHFVREENEKILQEL